MIQLKFIPKNISKSLMPMRATKGSVGYDIHADINQEIAIEPGKVNVIPTGIFLEAPTGTEDVYLRIAPRSGLAFRYGCDTLAGVVDPSYTKEVLVLLSTIHPFTVKPGDRIAQIIPEKVAASELYGDIIKVDDARVGGFGSTNRS